MAGLYEWGEIEFNLFDSMASGNANLYNDQWIQTLYDAALFDHDIAGADRGRVLNQLRDRMWEEYGIDFDDVFDWEDYRSAYDNAGV